MLEMNLIIFIGILFMSHSSGPLSVIKYFVIQAFASSLLLLAALSSTTGAFFWPDMMATCALAVKMGVPPFHNWFLTIAENTSWAVFTLLASAQKLAPLVAFSHFNYSPAIVLILLSSVIVASWGVFNQPYLRAILAYSSMFSSAWMLPLTNHLLALLYVFFLYTMTFITVVAPASMFDLSKKTSLKTTTAPFSSQVFFFLSMLNFSGIPPFLGAYLKINMLNLLMVNTFSAFTPLFVLQSAWFMIIYITIALNRLAFTHQSIILTTKISSFGVAALASLVLLPLTAFW